MYVFRPEEDITAAELSEAMLVLMLAPIAVMQQKPQQAADAIFQTLSEGAKRHFLLQAIPRIATPGNMPPPSRIKRP
jgi:hypothetical protein